MRKLGSLLCVCTLSFGAQALEVEGTNYPATTTIGEKTLKLVGGGLRKKWLVKVYTMGAYSESGVCDPKEIINRDEVKLLQINMKRDVSAEKMAATIGEAFEEHMPKNASAELKQQRGLFQSYFKDECSEGIKVEFLYEPGIGTTLKQNGKTLGQTLTGIEFHKVLWDIYFGPETCCESLRDQMLETCKQKPTLPAAEAR